MGIPVRLTGYWPRYEQTAMEGGLEGAARWRGAHVVDPSTGKRVQLHTLEDAQAGSSEYCSVSGDPDIWPFGQRIMIDTYPDIVFRVVDTGSHFTGTGKVYRDAGREPLDVCVNSPATPVHALSVATTVEGDSWDGGDIRYDLLPPGAFGEAWWIAPVASVIALILLIAGAMLA